MEALMRFGDRAMNKNIQAMSDYVFASRYARYLADKNRRSTWAETVELVKNMHLKKFPQVAADIEWAFDQVLARRVLGSQRALQYGGDPILKKNARLYNCTASYADRPRFFQEAFWLLLCGCGVGFSVQTHHVAKLPRVAARTRRTMDYVVADSIEGWSDALGALVSSYFISDQPYPEYAGCNLVFDYSRIRPKGAPLSSGVGTAPGSEGLQQSLARIDSLLKKLTDGTSVPVTLDAIHAYDIVMHASDAVLSGGVRRSATICLFSPDDKLMAEAKTGDWFLTNPQRGRSNNSALLIRNETTFEQFGDLMEHVKQFGEPGFVWADNRELLVNPCVEIGMLAYETFEDENGGIRRDEQGNPVLGRSGWEFCNLCEINGRMVRSEEDFEIAARAAAIIGTLQAGYTDFDYLGDVTKKIVEREALIGVSITGMMDNPGVLFDAALQKKMAKMIQRENARIAALIGINPAARATCIKPAGSTSLILGTASGIHPHHAKRYFRRVQSNKNEPTLQHFKQFNPMSVEESVWSATKSDEIVTFCVTVEKGAKTKVDIDAVSLLDLVKMTQKNWVLPGTRKNRCTATWLRHNVSNTIHVCDHEWKSVTDYIYKNREFFAGISLLPIHGDKDYPQAPFCRVYTDQEILGYYGAGSMMASGLIVDGLHAFGNDLWAACSAALEIGEPLVVDQLRKVVQVSPDRYRMEGINADTNDILLETWLLAKVDNIRLKRDWVRRARQFARRYFENDLRKMTYCLKDVNNLKLWNDLHREYVEVDYTQLYELTDKTVINQTVACAGGACEIMH